MKKTQYPQICHYRFIAFKLGYMFRPCGVIIRPLQFDEAVKHIQDNEQINNILPYGIPSGLHIQYIYICEIRVTDVTYFSSLRGISLNLVTASLFGGK
jgi:hypothetical protein